MYCNVFIAMDLYLPTGLWCCILMQSCSSPPPPHADKQSNAPPHTHTTHSDLCDAGTSEGHYNGHNVDSKLELEKLGDAVVDVPAPHYCLDDTAEVVVGQNDI